MNSALWHVLMMIVTGWMAKREQQEIIDYLKEESRVFREKLGVQRVRLNDDQRLRLAAKGKALGRRRLAEVCTIVTPDTILKWHRRLIAKKYDGSAKRRPGRPGVVQEIRRLIVRIAGGNERWGYRRIQGALANAGHKVSRSTVRRVLQEHGIDPAPERMKHTPWSTFLRAHWESIAAADFFNVEVWTTRGLIRYWVLFVVGLPTRRVCIAGVTSSPNGAWVLQLARQLADPFDGFFRCKRFLIHDRDPCSPRISSPCWARSGSKR